MRRLSFFACLIGLSAVACGEGCDNSGYSGPNTDSSTSTFTAPDGSQCADATPCGNCDQDCRPHGNPFLPGPEPVPTGGMGASDGSDGSGSGGGLASGGDGPGLGGGAGGGGTGFDGDPCELNSDCRGLCGADGLCDGHGEGGFNGDGCLSAADCRGECGGDGICSGSGTDPGLGGSVGGGIGGSCGPDSGTTPGGTSGTGGSDPGAGGAGGGTGGAGDPTDPGDGGDGSGTPDGSGGGTGTPGGGGTPGTTGGNPGAGGGGGGVSPDPSICQDLDIRLQHAIPTIALLIDQSGSMNIDFGQGMTRWDAEYRSLMDPNNGIVKEIESAFRIGMSLYSGIDSQTCPNLRDVRPELNNYDAIDRVFGSTDPLQETPTGESLLGTLRQFAVHQDQGRKIVLLSTDGEPDTCAEPNPQNGHPEAVAAAQTAYQQGIETILLSVGDEVGVPHLEDMANAGVGFKVGGAQQAPFYTANDPEQLTQQMQSILGSARSCIFRVQGGIIDPGVIDQASVTLDGVALELNAPDGWRYHQNVQTCQGGKQCIELMGQACETVQDGQSHIIHGDFMCAYYDPDNPPIGGGGGAGGPGGSTPGGDGTGVGGGDGDGSGTGTGDGSGSGTGDGTGGGGTSGGGTSGSDGGTAGGGGGTGGDYPCVYDPGTSTGGGGTSGGSGTGTGTGTGGGSGSGTGSGSGGGGGGMSCVPSSGACEYDGDCCSGFCSGSTSGICVIP